jgi:hypothetical protein
MTDPTKYIDCPACSGTGKTNDSECCSAPLIYEDTCCSECLENAEGSDCPICDGRGELDPIIYKQFIEDNKDFDQEKV